MELCDSVEKMEKRYIITIDRKVKALNVRSKNLKIRNLPKGKKRIDCINSKPFAFFGLCLVMGIILITLCQSYLIGGLFIIVSIYNFFFIKNEVLVEFYEDHAVFYHTTSYKDECYLLFWEDVASWEIHHAKSDYDELTLTLKNDKKVTLKCVSKHKIQRYLKRYVAVRQEKVIVPPQTSH